MDVGSSEGIGAVVRAGGGKDMWMQEAMTSVEEVHDRVNKDARVLFGARIDPDMDRTIRVMLVITGVKSRQILGPTAQKQQRQQKDMGLDFVL